MAAPTLRLLQACSEMVVKMKASLQDQAWVWTGDSFARPEFVAFKCSLPVRPYLHTVPSELSSFSRLFAACGIRDQFTVMQYIGLLTRMAKAGTPLQFSPADATSNSWWLLCAEAGPLDEDSFNCALSIVQHLADASSLADVVYVPDEASVLAPASELVYNDAPWLTALQMTQERLRFVHPKVYLLASHPSCKMRGTFCLLDRYQWVLARKWAHTRCDAC